MRPERASRACWIWVPFSAHLSTYSVVVVRYRGRYVLRFSQSSLPWPLLFHLQVLSIIMSCCLFLRRSCLPYSWSAHRLGQLLNNLAVFVLTWSWIWITAGYRALTVYCLEAPGWFYQNKMKKVKTHHFSIQNINSPAKWFIVRPTCSKVRAKYCSRAFFWNTTFQ